MFLLSILFGRLPGFDFKTIGFLPIDAFTQETITYSNEITENPIETGGVISDHIYAKPVGLRVTGVVQGGRRGLAYQLLVAMHNSRIPLFVVSGLQTFTNMAIKELTFPREVKDASSLQFTAEFRQLRFAVSSSAPSIASSSGGAANTAAPTANAGRGQATPASPASASAAQGTAASTGAAPRGSFLSRATGVGQ